MRVDGSYASPDGSAWARFSAALLASYAEHNPAVEQWRNLRVDPGLAGLAPEGGRQAVTIGSVRQADEWDEWPLPVEDVLGSRLAWHPARPLVAGLARQDRRAYPWVADFEARTVRRWPRIRAATSLTELARPPLPPLAWYDETRLLVLTAAPQPPSPDQASARPLVYEATGPAYVAFEPELGRLTELAGVTVAMLELEQDLGQAAPRPLTRRLLVRGLAMSDDGPVVEYVDEASTGSGSQLRWATGLVDVDGASPDPKPAVAAFPVAVSVPDDDPAPPGLGQAAPERVLHVPTGPDRARLTVWRTGPGPMLIWLNARRPGRLANAFRPVVLADPDQAGATLDLPLHWPADATVDLLHDQIIGAVRGSLDALAGYGAVLVGGHSFGATLALYALAHVPELTAAIVHSGCYNRTLTPTGFQYERRPYWEVPEIYHAFSALLFADRIDRPVLIVHGAEDTNPATPPDQAVHLYQGIVAAGGQARLVLLPYEGHAFKYQETREALAEVHSSWLARWTRQPDSAGR